MTADSLAKHARRFGTEGVIETALEARLPFQELVRLQTDLDEIDSTRRFHKKPRKTAEERIKKLLGIEEEASEQP